MPGCNAALGLVHIEVRSPGYYEDEKVVLQIVKSNSQRLRTLIGKRPYVYIFLESALFNQFDCNPAKLVYGMIQADVHDTAASCKSFVVLFEPENVGLLLFVVPVTPDPLEDTGTIMKGMGHYPYFGFLKRDELFLKISVRRHL